eukprot:790938-Amphidinium_carterae.1
MDEFSGTVGDADAHSPDQEAELAHADGREPEDAHRTWQDGSAALPGPAREGAASPASKHGATCAQ